MLQRGVEERRVRLEFWRCAAAKSPTGASLKKIENRLLAFCSECGTPSRSSASDAAFDTVSADRSIAAYTSSVALRSVASPAAVASGFRERARLVDGLTGAGGP